MLEGRRKFMSQFGRMGAHPDQLLSLEDLGRQSLESCRLSHETGARGALVSRLYRDLLALRREDPSLGSHAERLMGATLGERTMVLRYLGANRETDRLLIVNLGPDMNVASAAQPLVAPPAAHEWSLLWCSEDRVYGGSGAALSTPPAQLTATGHATSVFAPRLVVL